MTVNFLKRAHNMFARKVPKGAECCNIQAATVPFVQAAPVTVFVRLNRSIVLEDFCEISAPTRFLCLVLGPPGSETTASQMKSQLQKRLDSSIDLTLGHRTRSSPWHPDV